MVEQSHVIKLPSVSLLANNTKRTDISQNQIYIMQNYHRSSSSNATRRISVEQAMREASTGLRLEVTTTKLSLSKRDSKPCGVFATVVEGPLAGFSGMIYIGDIKSIPGKPAADVLQDLVNPPGQRLSVAIKQAEIETPTNGGKRLRLGFWQHAASTGATSEPEVAVATPAVVAEAKDDKQPQVEVPYTPAAQVTITVFINGEAGGFHTCSVQGALVADATAPEPSGGNVSTLEAALNLALEAAQAHKLQEVNIVDPARKLLTTKDAATLRVSQLRSMWLPTAKRKDAARK